ncbi:hypothetical protein [Photorhabdus sp. SF281]|uniref:hypothetical protein n=1 Tax=Photorhabdus sp. SF281 TaxID=3459527 RepID=UPI0040442862
MPAHRPHQEFMIDVIEEPLDVHVQHPVSAPASLPGYSQGIVFSDTFSIGGV